MKKFFALLLIAGLLVLPLSGCGFHFEIGDVDHDQDVVDPGEPGDEEDPGDADPGEPGEDGYTQKILSGNVFYPTVSEDVFAKYREFGFEWTEGDAYSVDGWSLHYLYEGTEEVNGEAAEVYTVTFVQSGETYVEKYWYNAQWECVKVMSGGQEVEWWYVSLPTKIYNYVDMALDAQLVFDQDGCIDTLAYNLEDEGSGTQGSPVGSMEVYVLRDLISNEVKSYGVTEIEGELIFAMFRHGEAGSEAYQELCVTHLVAK